MKFIIRADASVEIGSGHVMRCLTIADKLSDKGHDVQFLMLPLKGNLINYVQSLGYKTILDWQQTDIIIVDHYKIDATIEKTLYMYAKKIIVIDDLANRRHACDMLIDQNMLKNFQLRYDKLVPENCIKLLGSKYIIMRDEFIEMRHQRYTSKIEKLLVFMGGTDPTNETMKVLKALTNFNFKKVHVVCGDGNEKKEEIKFICEKRGYMYHQQINYMAKLMSEVDFLVGAGGGTTWERCYLGLPSSSTIVADNQKEGTEYLEQLKAIINLGWHEQVTSDTYQLLLKYIQVDYNLIQNISKRAFELTMNIKNDWLREILNLEIKK